MSRALACGLTLLLGGCQLLSGIGDLEAVDDGAGGEAGAPAGGAGGGDGGAGATVSCGPNESCSALAPVGWTGPVLLSLPNDGPMLPSCIQGAVETAVFVDLQIANPAICTCDCALPPPSAACAAASLELFDSDSCTACGPTQACQTVIAADACVAVTSSSATGQWAVVTAPSANDVACLAGGNDTIELPRLDKIRVCAFPDAKSCDDGACAPTVGNVFNRRCVFREGAGHACPAGSFSHPLAVFRSFEEGRSCTPCDCGTTDGATCGGSVSLHQGNPCNQAADQVVASGSCTMVEPTTFSSAYQPSVIGACSVTGGLPTGSPSGTDPVTMCCEQ